MWRSAGINKKVVVPALADIGTVNPEALEDEQFQHRSVYPVFEEASELAGLVAQLKAENEQLTEQLEQMVSDADETKYTKFKKSAMTFEKKLEKRERDLETFSKHLNAYRSDSFPTFVEVQALNQGRHKPGFDAINASLLVSNQQRSFFASEFMTEKNDELKALITEQEQALRLLEARLKLFSSYEKASTTELMINSLKNGVPPGLLTNRVPTTLEELRTKQRALSSELAALVKERKSLAQRRIAAKLVRRRRRERMRKSLQKQQEDEEQEMDGARNESEELQEVDGAHNPSENEEEKSDRGDLGNAEVLHHTSENEDVEEAQREVVDNEGRELEEGNTDIRSQEGEPQSREDEPDSQETEHHSREDEHHSHEGEVHSEEEPRSQEDERHSHEGEHQSQETEPHSQEDEHHSDEEPHSHEGESHPHEDEHFSQEDEPPSQEDGLQTQEDEPHSQGHDDSQNDPGSISPAEPAAVMDEPLPSQHLSEEHEVDPEQNETAATETNENPDEAQ